ncbi:MAG: response regulator [Anaerolineales bacterium]|nr:response regulator [Anaerolineales bacterium]
MNRPIKILLVEDEFIIATLLQRNLELLGYQVCELAATGEQAIEIANKEKPDVCLMDIRLSGPIDGIEAGKIITEKHQIPLVYTTGYSDSEMKKRANELNPVAYLIKPVTPDDLKPVIDKILSMK